MSINFFKNLTFELMEGIKEVPKNVIDNIDYSYNDPNKKKSIFYKPKYLPLHNRQGLILDYEYISIIDEEPTHGANIGIVKQFAEFLILAEKCFFYNNTEESSVYSIEDKDGNITIVFNPIDLETTIEVSFKGSEIDMPLYDDDFPSFLFGEDEKPSKTVVFVTVSVLKEFGNKSGNKYKFIIDSSPVLNDVTDILLYENVMFIIKRMIFDCLNDIIINHMIKLTDIKVNTSVKELIYNGIRIR